MAGLPFLKHRKMSEIIMMKAKPEGSSEVLNEEGEHGPELMSAAEDLIRAVHMKDASAVADALKAAFDMMEAQPLESPQGE